MNGNSHQQTHVTHNWDLVIAEPFLHLCFYNQRIRGILFSKLIRLFKQYGATIEVESFREEL